MVKIEAIDFRSLRNMVHLSLHEDGQRIFSAYISQLPVYQQRYAAWCAALKHERAMLKPERRNGALATVTQECEAMYACWVSLRKVLRMQAESDFSPYQSLAKVLYTRLGESVAKKHDGLLRKCQAVNHALHFVTVEPYAALIDNLGVRMIAQKMDESYEAVQAALYENAQHRREKPTGAGLAARAQTDKTYREFIEVVRLEMLLEPAVLKECVDTWNVEVKHSRTALRIKQSLAQLKRKKLQSATEPESDQEEED